MSDLQIFNFEENQVRTLMIDNEPWFVANDVLKAMNSTTKVTDLKSMIEEDLGDEFVTNKEVSDNYGRMNKMLCLSEPAVILFLCRYRTELGKAMNRWIHSEVLPSIRKTGSYSVKQLSPGEQIVEMGKAIISLEKEQARQAQELEQTKEISSQALSIAQEVKKDLENVRDELASLRKFAVAPPEASTNS
ncbi:MAG: Bro-N domain-containing protein [Halothece sp.]